MVKVVVIRVDDKDWKKIDRLRRKYADTWRDVLDKYVRIYG